MEKKTETSKPKAKQFIDLLTKTGNNEGEARKKLLFIAENEQSKRSAQVYDTFRHQVGELTENQLIELIEELRNY